MNAVVHTERADQFSAMSADSHIMMSLIDRLVANPEFDIGRLRELLAVKKEWDAEAARRAYTAAMAAFKSEPLKIFKTKDVNIPGGAKFKHATLADVCDGVVANLGKHGLSHSWVPKQLENNWVEITCVMTHEAGHSERFTLRGPPDDSGKKSVIQQIASTKTLLERYTLTAAVGLGASDMEDADDRSAPKAAPAIPAPEGYERWKADMTAKAEEGTAALQQAWAASEGMRGYAATIDELWWRETKAKAAAATKASRIVQ